jgi:hypothetical protein
MVQQEADDKHHRAGCAVPAQPDLRIFPAPLQIHFPRLLLFISATLYPLNSLRGELA